MMRCSARRYVDGNEWGWEGSGYCGRAAVEEVGVLGHGKLDDAVASQPRIKIDATRRSLKYSDLGRFLATPEKRKKTGIDQMLT